MLWCPHRSQRCSSNPPPGGQDAPDKTHLAQRCQEKPFSSWRQIAKSLSRISLRDGLILHMKGSRTRKTALAQGKVLVNSGLKARAGALMHCQQSPPARKPGMSHSTSRRNLPIWIEKQEQNFAFSPRFSSSLCHIHSCTVILSNCMLQTSKRKRETHRRDGDGLPSSTFFFFLKGEKMRQEGVKGPKGFYQLVWIPVCIGVYCIPHLRNYKPKAHTASASPL